MVASKPLLSVFGTSDGLGHIFKENDQINVKFWEINLPFTDTTGRTSVQLGGKNRIIMIQGSHDGTGFGTGTDNEKLALFISTMEGWVNAKIQTHRVYTNSFDVEFNVDAVDWSWTRSFDDPFRILYTLIMKAS